MPNKLDAYDRVRSVIGNGEVMSLLELLLAGKSLKELLEANEREIKRASTAVGGHRFVARQSDGFVTAPLYPWATQVDEPEAQAKAAAQ